MLPKVLLVNPVTNGTCQHFWQELLSRLSAYGRSSRNRCAHACASLG